MELVKIDDLIRVGRNIDGGYVISESLMNSSSYLLSFGINDDWSFEKDFYKKSRIKCCAFDFSINRGIFFKRGIQQIRYVFGDIIKRKKLDLSRFKNAGHQFSLFISFNLFFIKSKFFSYGVDNTTHGKFITLDKILNKFLKGENNIFLKVDIEGFEFQIIDDIIKNSDRFHALAMEIHGIHKNGNQFDLFLSKLRSQFYTYHIHANNYGNTELKNGFPDVIEISCIRKELITFPVFYESKSHLPIPGLDFPNNRYSDDLVW